MFLSSVLCNAWEESAKVISAKDTDIPKTTPKEMPHIVVAYGHWTFSSNITCLTYKLWLGCELSVEGSL